MKERLLRLICSLGVLLAAALSYSQTVHTDLNIEADIPFNFVVGQQTMPAAHYTIRSFGASDGQTLLVRSADGQSKAILRAHGVQAVEVPEKCKLIFLVAGGHHFLHEMWLPGNQRGHQLPQNPEFVELAKRTRADEIMVAARQR